MVRAGQHVGHCLEATVADLDDHRGIGQQVGRPLGTIAGGHQHGSVGLIDIPHRDRSRRTGAPTARRDPGDLALEEEVVAEVVRQRPRCQDLPSVWVEGA